MKRNILLLSFALASLSAIAQQKSFKEESNFWLKSDKQLKDTSIFNGHAPLQKNSNTQLSTKIGKDYSNYYLVYRSLDSKPVDLLDLNMACYKHTMTTHNINFHDENLKNEKIKTGAIVKQSFHYPAESDNQFLQVILEDDKTDLYEFVYVNKEFDLIDHKKIQTYLSIKYGISLIDSDNYYDDTIGNLWDKSKDFSNFITSIGRNDYYQLNTLKAVNSVQNQYSISANYLKDREYVMVGSNAGDWKMITKENEIVLDKYFYFKPISHANLDFVFTINTNNLENKSTDKAFILYKNNDFTKPVAIGIDGNNGQVNFNLNSQDISENDEFMIAYSAKPNAEIVVDKNEINVYPNPIKENESVNIDFNFNRKTDVEVYVYQLDGKLISRKTIKEIDQMKHSIQLHTVGNYIVALLFDGKTQIHKITVN